MRLHHSFGKMLRVNISIKTLKTPPQGISDLGSSSAEHSLCDGAPDSEQQGAR